MPPKQTDHVAREGDTLDAAIDAADLRVSQADEVYKTWRNRGLTPALQLVTRFKDAAARVGMADQVMAMAGGGVVARQKAAPGMQTIELPAELAVALTRARSTLGDAQIVALLGGTGQPQAGVGTLTSDQKPPSRKKAAPATHGLARLFDEGIKELNQ